MNNMTSSHLYSPLGDSRERAVPCAQCSRPTWNICARCDQHCQHESQAQNCPAGDPQ